jgi:hypothetical protein
VLPPSILRDVEDLLSEPIKVTSNIPADAGEGAFPDVVFIPQRMLSAVIVELANEGIAVANVFLAGPRQLFLGLLSSLLYPI